MSSCPPPHAVGGLRTKVGKHEVDENDWTVEKDTGKRGQHIIGHPFPEIDPIPNDYGHLVADLTTEVLGIEKFSECHLTAIARSLGNLVQRRLYKCVRKPSPHYGLLAKLLKGACIQKISVQPISSSISMGPRIHPYPDRMQ